MGRTTFGAARHKRKVRTLKASRGFRGARRNHYRLAKEAIIRAGVYAFRDRRARKRDFRALWVTRLTAACRARGIKYSRFIYGIAAANIELNRKVMSEMAIHNPTDFDALVEIARKHAPKEQAAA